MQELAKLIANGNLKEALQVMSLYPSKFNSNEVILTSARLSGLSQNIRLGIISHSDAQITKNQISSAVISLANQAGVNQIQESTTMVHRGNESKLDKIQQDLESIVKQILFDSEYKEEKKAARVLIQEIKNYRVSKIQDPSFDIEEKEIAKIEGEYLSFHQKAQLRLRNRRKVKLKAIDEYMNLAEENLNKSSLTNLASALVAFNTDLKDFRPLIEKASEIELEAIAQDMAKVVFSL